MIVSCNVPLISCVIGAYVPYLLSLVIVKVYTRITPLQTARFSRIAALKIHLVYLGRKWSREQMILNVRLVSALLELLALLNRNRHKTPTTASTNNVQGQQTSKQ